MKNKTVVVVGGVAGGMSFATRFRRLNPEAHIIVVEKGEFVSFANCGLPYYIANEISDQDDLLVVDPSVLEQRFQLDIRPFTEAVEIDYKHHQLKVLNQQNESFIAYDQLVLAPGAKPIDLMIEGKETIPNFSLRNIPDAQRIVDYVKERQPKHATVVGAGFIGLEMVESLVNLGIKVGVVEKANQVLPPLDPEMAAFALKQLKEKGVEVYTGDEVIHIDHQELTLASKTKINSDFLILSVGVRADTNWLEQSGMALNQRGGIMVDDTFRTNLEDVYAVGDAIEVKHYITQQPVMIPLASPANRQGRQLADILSGHHKTYSGTLGTSIVRLFDLTLASTGLSEKQTPKGSCHVMHLTANDHAGYYPEATPIFMKVIFNKEDGRIVGAQAAGQKGIDKRIDVIATAIKGRMTIEQLQELELSYAPPFGSAKDIVNLAGYYGENIMNQLTKTVQWHQVEAMVNQKVQMVDVRSVIEYQQGSLPTAINLPLDQLRCTYSQLSHDRPVLVFCQSGIRSYNAELILRAAGFEVYNLDGSYGYYHTIKEMETAYV